MLEDLLYKVKKIFFFFQILFCKKNNEDEPNVKSDLCRNDFYKKINK